MINSSEEGLEITGPALSRINSAMILARTVCVYQERKISPKRKFLGQISRGHPGVVPADIPAQNFGQGPPNPGKTSISARTSVTRRRGRPRPWGFSRKLRSEKLWAEFSFPIRGGKSTRKNPPKIKKFTWTSSSEQFWSGSWFVSQGRGQKFARTFRKSSRKRGVFLVFRDFGWVCGSLP